MEQHPADAQGLGQAAGVLAAGAAVAHQQHTAQVVAALDRDAADGAGHGFDRNRQGALGHLFGRGARHQRRKAAAHRLQISRLIAAGAEHRR
jgi:hypothetical protein